MRAHGGSLQPPPVRRIAGGRPPWASYRSGSSGPSPSTWGCSPGICCSTRPDCARSARPLRHHPARRRARPRTAGPTDPSCFCTASSTTGPSSYRCAARSAATAKPHIEALNYSPLLCDLRTAAALLGRHVEEVCARTGHGQVDVIGHSLGGLIARYYVQRLGGDARVHTLVTLGTPHSGTRIAPLLSAHPLVRQMCPDSEVITELRQPAPDCHTRFIAFWSDVDQLMIPAETARIDHPDVISQNIRVNGIGHLALAVHSSVAVRIREALDAPDEAPHGRLRHGLGGVRRGTATRRHKAPRGSSAGPKLPNANRTPGQGTAYSQPKDGQMPFAVLVKSHGRLSLPRTAGYSRR